MRWVLGVVALAVVLSGGYLTYRWLFPPDEVVIRKVLRQAAAAASWDESGGALERLAGAGRLATLCTRDVQVLLDTQGARSRRLQGREEVRQAGVAARAQVPWLRLQLSDVAIRVVEPGVKATVLMAATATAAGASEPLVQDYELTLRREDGEWLIERVQPVRGFGM